jgi:RecB family exonuclease
MLEQWRRAAPSVIASYARLSRTGEARSRSPLLPEAEVTYADDGTAGPKRERPLVPVDDNAPAADPASAALTASAIRDQSLCPFRAFAIHRLGATAPASVSLLPTPDERGITVHEALQHVYRTTSSRSALVALSAEERLEVAKSAARTALRASTQRSAPERFLASEEERLTRVLLDWFDVDMARPDFAVESVEQELTTVIAAAPLRIRLDRVDRDVATGERIVLDYKTGHAGQALWRGQRPEDPQLPLYTTAVAGVRCIAFAEVGATGSRLTGLAASPDRYARNTRIRVGGPSAFGAQTWDDLLAEWRAMVTSLAEAFLRGHAAVEPLHAGVCKTCHLHALCRIDDRRAVTTDA